MEQLHIRTFPRHKVDKFPFEITPIDVTGEPVELEVPIKVLDIGLSGIRLQIAKKIDFTQFAVYVVTFSGRKYTLKMSNIWQEKYSTCYHFGFKLIFDDKKEFNPWFQLIYAWHLYEKKA